MADNYVEIDCMFVRSTLKAVLIDIGGDEFWVPRSCIHGGDEIRIPSLDSGDEVTLKIFQWFAEKEGLL